MKKIFLLGALCLAVISLTVPVTAQSVPSIEWQKSIGGSGEDVFYSFTQVSDGFIWVGRTNSNDGDVEGNFGDYDAWIVKTDFQGNIVWQKCHGGTKYDEFKCVSVRPNGEIIALGSVMSKNGEVSGKHGPNTVFDAWVVRLAADGALVDQRCLGGDSTDIAYALHVINDDNIVVTVSSKSKDADFPTNYGGYDIWVVTLNADLEISSKEVFGGSGDDFVSDIIVENGYANFTCTSNSTDGDWADYSLGGFDAVMFRFNLSSIFDRVVTVFGGEDDDALNCMAVGIDGDFLYGGTNRSVTENAQQWQFKYSPDQTSWYWETFNGGNGTDSVNAICPSGSSSIAAGTSNSSDVVDNHGGYDMWLVRNDFDGNNEWKKSFGGTGDDAANEILSLGGGKLLIGGSSSSNDGDISGNHGGTDAQIIMLIDDFGTGAPPLIQVATGINIYPNPMKTQTTIELDLSEASSVNITLADRSGHIINEVANERLFAGKHSISVQIPELPSGMYFMRITANGGKSIAKKVTVQQ